MALGEQFVKQLKERHAPDLAGIGRRFSSGEVADMSPEEHSAMLDHAASIQRGHPENTMLRFQRATGGGLLSHSAEHIGDLTHRLNERGGRYGTEFVAPKVRTQLNSLQQGYGYEREHMEQMRSNARMRGVSVEEHLEEVSRVGGEYAQAHRAVPIYNKPSMLGNTAAINLGKMDFNATTRSMRRLHEHVTNPDQFHELMSQRGTVDFLRGEEEKGWGY